MVVTKKIVFFPSQLCMDTVIILMYVLHLLYTYLADISNSLDSLALPSLMLSFVAIHYNSSNKNNLFNISTCNIFDIIKNIFHHRVCYNKVEKYLLYSAYYFFPYFQVCQEASIP